MYFNTDSLRIYRYIYNIYIASICEIESVDGCSHGDDNDDGASANYIHDEVGGVSYIDDGVGVNYKDDCDE